MPRNIPSIVLRFSLGIFAGLLVGSLAVSDASAELKIERTSYRVHITGQHIYEWQGQTVGFPDSNKPWSTEKGKVTAGFSTPGGVVFKGIKWSGTLPGGQRPAPFTFSAIGPVVAKAKNRASFRRKINQVPSCGGELGECTGNEPKGVKVTSDGCFKPNSRIPIIFEFDVEKGPDVFVEFGNHKSMVDFCGRKYPGTNSVERLPEHLRMPKGLDEIADLNPGQSITRKRTYERGYVGGDGHADGTRVLRTCPEMSGIGSRQCLITDLNVEIKRIK